ncbi:hypothetical protein C9I57_13450 [Trinickia symbiotica]|uniref:Uncharacterized protein n=1 Tax=Trinickia symbiotica TaxID=863227 RepID=A0A2T3XUC6_9BURK|nr:hypothetical protein [Trinickia symbiotica]PTB20108.1 hypothetical protein C9I57_13450 [Trinickia symbiotica]
MKQQWHSRPLEVRVFDRCDECGELKEDVRERVNHWPKFAVVCCATCFADLSGDFSDPAADFLL